MARSFSPGSRSGPRSPFVRAGQYDAVRFILAKSYDQGAGRGDHVGAAAPAVVVGGEERIVAAKPGAIASEVARAADYTSQLYRWRQQLGPAPTPTTFNAVVIAPEPASASPALREQAGVIEIEFAFGGRMRITGPVATSTVKALIAVLARSSLMCRRGRLGGRGGGRLDAASGGDPGACLCG